MQAPAIRGAPQPRHRPLLESLENLAIKRPKIPRLPGWCQIRPTPPCGWRPDPALGKPSAAKTGAAGDAPPILNRMGGGWHGAGPRTGPQEPWRKVALRILVKPLMPTPPGPRVRLPADAAWQHGAGGFLPPPSPTPDKSKAISEVKARHGEAPARWTAGPAAMWAFGKPSGEIRALVQGGDSRQSRRALLPPTNGWLAQQQTGAP